jgi:hypothetical protein
MTPHSPPKPASESASPYERFDTFTRKLLAVPKADIDKREVEYQREKKIRKKRKRK